MHRRVVVKACHASGKTFASSVATLWGLACHPQGLVFTTAPTGRQVSNVLWKEIGIMYRNARIVLGGRLFQTARIEFADDWFAFGFATDRPDAAQGLHAPWLLGILDEASGVTDEVFRQAKANCAGGDAHLLIQGNPLSPDGQFFQEVMSPADDVVVISISAYDTPNFSEAGITEADMLSGDWREKAQHLPYPDSLITPQYVADVLAEDGVGSPAYVARVLGEFPESNPHALIPYWAVEEAVERWRDYEKNPETALVKPGEPTEIGVDVADQGDDKSVRAIRQGGYVHELRVMTHAEPPETAGHVMRDMDEFPGAVAKIDSIGIGNEVANRLREAGRKFVKWNAAESSSNQEKFRNKRDEGYWGLRMRLTQDRDTALPPDRLLQQELTAIQWKPNARGQNEIESRESIVKRIHRSPDRATAVMMAFASGRGVSGAMLSKPSEASSEMGQAQGQKDHATFNERLRRRRNGSL